MSKEKKTLSKREEQEAMVRRHFLEKPPFERLPYRQTGENIKARMPKGSHFYILQPVML